MKRARITTYTSRITHIFNEFIKLFIVSTLTLFTTFKNRFNKKRFVFNNTFFIAMNLKNVFNDVNNDTIKNLIDLIIIDKIYLSEISNDEFMFRDELSRRNLKILTKCVITLSLTKICCEIDKNKICQNWFVNEFWVERRF